MAIEDLEASLGLTFKDRGLLQQALVHRSYLNENGGSPLDSYERMEFLGDAVLEIIVSTELYSNLPQVTEGELTKRRSSLVCRASLARAARRISLGDFLALGKGEMESGGYRRESILEEAFESVLAAVYLDQGYEAARRFALSALEPDLVQIFRGGSSVENPKSRLQEMVQGIGLPTPRYQQISVEGPDHLPIFTVEVLVGDDIMGRGAGSKKSDAERAAAQSALDAYQRRQETLAQAQWYGSQDPSLNNEPEPSSARESRERKEYIRNDNDNSLCSHSSRETGKATRKKPPKVSSEVENAGSGVFSAFSGPLIWMKRLGKSSKKS